jgi:hypothetical protein
MQLNSTDQDFVIAGGLISSPAWASWLNDINGVLTASSLSLGIVLGLVRLWLAWRDISRRDK